MHMARTTGICQICSAGWIAVVFAIFAALHAVPLYAAVPGVPIIAPASGGNRQVTVNFTAPLSNGGSAITAYTVTSNPGGFTATGSASPITITGLTNGTPYTFTVIAANADGSSAPAVTPFYTTPRLYAPATGTINNLVVFIRFSDQPEFTQPISYYDALFNTAANSLKNFYLENSYSVLTVNSTFYPLPNNGSVLSYQDQHPTSYYQGTGPVDRETVLVTNALNSIKDKIPSDLILDEDNDGFIDHITFEVYSTASNPLPGMFYSRATYDTSGAIVINGKNVGSYTWVTASQDNPYPQTSLADVEIHEMGHSFGYPDLRGNSGRTPVGDWDVMSMSRPVHSGAYLKYKFTKWIADIPEITPTSYGSYTINDLTQATNNSYKIKLPNKNEFLVLEYRKASGPFESHLPGSGLCISRVNEAAGIWGNLGGPPFFLYYYRPGGTFASDGSASNSFACLNAESGRMQFNDFSNPACFLSDGSPCGISIDAIGTSSGTSMTFSITDPATTIVTRVISGYLYNGGNRVSGATVTLSGSAGGVVTTDSLGRYLFTVNSGGNYTITPAKANLSFTPLNQTFTNLTSDQIQNFPATNNTITISGTITSAGTPLSGVSVTCNGGNYPPPVTTDATGAYACTVYAGSDYDVRAAKTNYFFSPNSKVFTNITTDQVQNFTTWTATVNLTGTVTYNGTPLSGVNVSCPGSTSATPIITGESGSYSFTVTVGNGSVYTVTPATPLYAFTPLNRFYTGLISSQVQNFTAAFTPTLDVTYNGSGGGTVTDGAGYNCSGTPCPTASFPAGTAVTLYAAADTNSLFTGWNPECGITGNCVLSMDAAKSVSVTFDRLQWAKNDKQVPSFYGLLKNAYSAAGSGDIIKLQNRTFFEELLLDNGRDVTIDGGYDPDYQNNGGYTILQGSMAISQGKVVVRNIKIR